MADSMEIVKQYFQQISLEVQPLETDEYRLLMDHGLHSVYVYQETYNRERYPVYHLRGRKADYRYRLETPRPPVRGRRLQGRRGQPDRAGGLAHRGVLHGRCTSATGEPVLAHEVFDRLPAPRPYYGEDGFNPEHPTTERNLLQLICAYRLLSEDVELSISTRESAACRDTVMPFGVTVMSAGSKTTPGDTRIRSTSWSSGPSTTPGRPPRCSTPSGPKGSSPCGRIGRFSCRKRIFPRKFCYICHSRAKLRTVFRRGWTLSHPSIPRSGLSAVFRGGGPREGTCEY